MRIAVVGATGLVGRLMVDQLASEVDALELYASRGGRTIESGGRSFEVLDVECFEPDAETVVLSSTPDDVAARLVPVWLDRGACVIDESASFRRNAEACLAVAGIQRDAAIARARLIACPNCTTTQVALALAPLHRTFGVREVVASSYQAASGAGRDGLAALEDADDETVFGRPLAGDLVPWIGRDLGGRTSEEDKLAWELPHLLEAAFPVHATCVRVPVAVGHAVSLWVRFDDAPDRALEVLRAGEGLRLVDGAPGPRAVVGTDDVLVARVRPAGPRALALWCLGDNLRVGAASNAIRLARIVRDARGAQW